MWLLRLLWLRTHNGSTYYCGRRHARRTGRLYLPWLYLLWQAAWKEERQQREALEAALAGSLGEVEQRPVAYLTLALIRANPNPCFSLNSYPDPVSYT